MKSFVKDKASFNLEWEDMTSTAGRGSIHLLSKQTLTNARTLPSVQFSAVKKVPVERIELSSVEKTVDVSNGSFLGLNPSHTKVGVKN